MMRLASKEGQVIFEGNGGRMILELIFHGWYGVPIVVLMDELSVREVEDVLDNLVDVGLHRFLVALIVGSPGSPELAQFRRRPSWRTTLRIVPHQNEPGALLARPRVDRGAPGDSIGVRNVYDLT
jgi:hypothetical protein